LLFNFNEQLIFNLKWNELAVAGELTKSDWGTGRQSSKNSFALKPNWNKNEICASNLGILVEFLLLTQKRV